MLAASLFAGVNPWVGVLLLAAFVLAIVGWALNYVPALSASVLCVVIALAILLV